MKDSELQIFVDSLRYYFATNIGGDMDVSPAYHTESNETPASEYTGIIGVSGDKQGCIYLTATKAMLGQVLLAMGEPEIDPSLFNDVIGEITNTVSGNARKVLGPGFMISVPIVVTGRPEYIHFPRNYDIGVVPFTWNGHQASLVVCLQ
ncbi:MAG TPA: chemotaxis protein CheX [Pseudomonadales bacterium]|nr:chemotaxis protein CheX [Pseudomonadales bacterium]